jgi:hypothetical protein
MNGSMDGTSGLYGLYLPNQVLMMHQLFIMLAVCLTAIPIAIVVYYLVLPRPSNGNDGSKGMHNVLGRATVMTVHRRVVAWDLLVPL